MRQAISVHRSAISRSATRLQKADTPSRIKGRQNRSSQIQYGSPWNPAGTSPMAMCSRCWKTKFVKECSPACFDDRRFKSRHYTISVILSGAQEKTRFFRCSVASTDNSRVAWQETELRHTSDGEIRFCDTVRLVRLFLPQILVG